jgi:hypothetical protein
MKCVEPCGLCPNFCGNRKRTVKLPEPPNDEVRYIALTRDSFAIVDAADYEWLNQYKWCASDASNPYACRHKNGVTVFMHREIMQTPKGMVVDHIDGSRQNNRRSNLRICTQQQNVFNCRKRRDTISRFKGVTWNKDARKWAAGITYDGEPIYLGLFDDEIVAARTYDFKAMELFGEYARLNFPQWSRLEDGRWRQRICEPARLMRLAMIRRGFVATASSAR